MLPARVVAAANFLKSGEAVIPLQRRVPAPVRTFQFTPLSMDIYMLLLPTVAASLLKSGEEAIANQPLLPALVTAAQLTPLSLDM
jgi:hypothetical protein